MPLSVDEVEKVAARLKNNQNNSIDQIHTECIKCTPK